MRNITFFIKGKTMFSTKFITKEKLPLVIEAKDKNVSLSDLLSELRSKNSYFKEELLKHGGLLFRNFPINNAKDFHEVIKALGTGSCVDYIGGDSPRNKVEGNIYTSTETPPFLKLPLHNELSFVKNYPSHIYFYCDVASPIGGETILGDTRKIFNEIDPKVKEKFCSKQLKYTSRYYYKNSFMEKYIRSHKTWINVFETEDKKEVEQKCKENDFGYKWNKNDWIEIHQVRPAILTHPQTNETVWFNQVHLYDFNPKFLGLKAYLGAKLFYFRKHTKLHEICYADDSKISRKDIYHILDVLEKNTLYFKWQKGDVLALDNILAMHGRAPFSGKRRILTAMTR